MNNIVVVCNNPLNITALFWTVKPNLDLNVNVWWWMKNEPFCVFNMPYSIIHDAWFTTVLQTFWHVAISGNSLQVSVKHTLRQLAEVNVCNLTYALILTRSDAHLLPFHMKGSKILFIMICTTTNSFPGLHLPYFLLPYHTLGIRWTRRY